MDATTGQPLFEVTDQQQANVLRSDGTLGVQWTVHLRASNGVTGYITVPGEDYTAANVHNLAVAWAQNVLGVAGLTGTNPPT